MLQINLLINLQQVDKMFSMSRVSERIKIKIIHQTFMWQLQFTVASFDVTIFPLFLLRAASITPWKLRSLSSSVATFVMIANSLMFMLWHPDLNKQLYTIVLDKTSWLNIYIRWYSVKFDVVPIQTWLPTRCVISWSKVANTWFEAIWNVM